MCKASRPPRDSNHRSSQPLPGACCSSSGPYPKRDRNSFFPRTHPNNHMKTTIRIISLLTVIAFAAACAPKAPQPTVKTATEKYKRSGK
jgi:hypothetical protein